MTTFLDTDVILDILDAKSAHHGWSQNKFVFHRLQGPLLISDIVYCEVSVGMPDKASLDAVVSRLGLTRHSVSDVALFRAGKAYLQYRKASHAPKNNVLPDFIIGAIAEVEGTPLLTRNHKDYKKYFSALTLIHP